MSLPGSSVTTTDPRTGRWTWRCAECDWTHEGDGDPESRAARKAWRDHHKNSHEKGDPA